MPTITTENQLNIINEILKKNDTYLIIKFHFGAKEENIHRVKYSNIIFLSSTDVKKININMYSIFRDTDALISDYSSVTFDYMYVNKPIAYIIDDMNEYKLGFAFENILDYMPGDHISSFDELKEFLTKIINNEDSYREQREKIFKYVNEFRDNKNAERVVKRFVK